MDVIEFTNTTICVDRNPCAKNTFLFLVTQYKKQGTSENLTLVINIFVGTINGEIKREYNYGK